MSFAEAQLAKFGWKKGEGLGKNKTGITKSISVVKKNDTKGLGGKLDKWDFAWWDHVFNKSASNIKVVKDEASGEVAVEKDVNFGVQKSKMGIISTSRPAGVTNHSPASSGASTPTMVARDDYADDDKEEKKPVVKSGPSWLFGFVKASASSQAAEDAKKTNQEFTTSAASFKAHAGAGYDSMKEAEKDEYKDYSIKVTDEELFLACEGRTARKGARGEQPGKLGRVMQEMLVATGKDSKGESTSTSTSTASSLRSSSVSSSDSELEKSTKKKAKKEKKSKSKKEKKDKKKKRDDEGETKSKKSKKEKKEDEGKSSKKRKISESDDASQPKAKKVKKEKKDKGDKREKKSSKKFSKE
ncbi:G patch domain-containing protein 4 [Actinomortierella wolfii]|nr:G patch domain-containing protein 4 [Actinomortierella wolfii]